MICPECRYKYIRDISKENPDICPNCGADVIQVTLNQLDDITVKQQPEELVDEDDGDIIEDPREDDSYDEDDENLIDNGPEEAGYE